MNTIRSACIIAASMLASGCTTFFAYTNEDLGPPERAKVQPSSGQASFSVSGERGNPKVLVLLALSGGGSRAAYFSASVMLRLQKIFPGIDLLQEVDAISSVSGGSIAAAYYAISKDASVTSPALAALIAPPQDKNPFPPGTLQADSKGTLTCSKELGRSEVQKVRDRVADPYLAARVIALCNVVSNRVWDEPTVKDLMTRDYVWNWIGNWFWPWNIGRYWFTSYDRADIMAQTLADTLYDVKFTGDDLSFADLNPERPNLIINATNATGVDGSGRDRFPFGSIFTFTEEDFRERIRSDIARYSVARAVMGSAAFPMVFPGMTLMDFSALDRNECKNAKDVPDTCNRYLHVFDGGNSDNLGLATLKRVLFEAAAAGTLDSFRHIVVISIDAFTKPAGISSTSPDARESLFSYFLDANLVSAVDSLLEANRANSLKEFEQGTFSSIEKECNPELRNFPDRLCEKLRNTKAGETYKGKGKLDLTKKLVFYHIGFEDVGDVPSKDTVKDKDGNSVTPRLKDRLDRIPTSLNISKPDISAIDQAVDIIVKSGNKRLQAICEIVANLNPKDPHERCKAVDLPR